MMSQRVTKTLAAVAVVVQLICVAAVPARAGNWFEEYGIRSKEELRSPASTPMLIKALGDNNANVRKEAAKSLGRIRPATPEMVLALVVIARDDKHENVRAVAVQALGAMGREEDSAAPALLDALGDKEANVRRAAINGLFRMGYAGDDFRIALHHISESDPHRRVKADAAKVLARLGPPKRFASGDVTTVAVPTTKLPRTEMVNRYGVAVIIGNRNYSSAHKDVPDVDFAHNDADRIYEYVTATLGFREGNVILIKDASQADLMATFGNRSDPKGKLYDWVRPDQSDVFVFYSGHGGPGLSDGRGYLLPVDGIPMKVELNGYPLETFYANLGKVPARSLTVVIDACFSGANLGRSVVKDASSISLNLRDTEVGLPNATIITAAGLSEVASWDREAKLGLFTSHFLRGVSGEADGRDYGNGDGKITLAELKKYLQEEVTYDARRLYGRDQNPQVSGEPSRVLAETGE